MFLNPDRQFWTDYHSTGSNNNSHYYDDEFDAMLVSARGEFDEAAQQEIYKNAARHLFEYVPTIPVLESTSTTVWQPELQGWSPQDGSTNFLHWKWFEEAWLDV